MKVAFVLGFFKAVVITSCSIEYPDSSESHDNRLSLTLFNFLVHCFYRITVEALFESLTRFSQFDSWVNELPKRYSFGLALPLRCQCWREAFVASGSYYMTV